MTEHQIDLAFFILDVLATSGAIFTGVLAAYLIGVEQTAQSALNSKTDQQVISKLKALKMKIGRKTGATSLHFFIWVGFLVTVKVLS